MKNFLKLAEGVDVTPLNAAIARQPELWNANTLRTKHPHTAHGQVDDIWVRFNEVDPQNPLTVVDDTECINYPAMFKLPQIRPLLFGLMKIVEGERMGRVLITKMKPGTRINPHVDMGAPADYYDRYHIVLASTPGCVFRAGEEKVWMRPGEVWWFDNKQEHEVVNNGTDDRTHIVVDIRTTR